MLSFVLLLTAIDACGIYLYEHDHFGGGVHYYNKDTPRTKWEDEYSSAKVVGEPGCHAWVYEHANFGGWGKRLDVGTYTKHQLWSHRVHSDAISSVKVVNLCHLWGCTCQGHSDMYMTHAGVGWGNVGKQAEETNIAAWWKGRNCKTKPTCTAWGCSCQGLSNTYGTNAGVGWGTVGQQPQIAKIQEFWREKGCKTAPNNRCLAKHCNGHWKLKSLGWRIVCPGGNCQTNTNMCCKIDGCDKVRVVGIEYKKVHIWRGPPKVKHLSAYTVDGQNCGTGQEKPLDSFVRTKEVQFTHEESMELGTSLEETFGWSRSQESTIEWSESASMSMDVPLGDGSLGMEHSVSKLWSKTSAFAQEGGVSKGASTNKMTAISKAVTETIEFNGISTAVPAYAWHRHRAYYHERPIDMTLELTVQCIVNGKNMMEKKIPGTKIVTATESHTKFLPLEDLTASCPQSYYKKCECVSGLVSEKNSAHGCTTHRFHPAHKGCYVYIGNNCGNGHGLGTAKPPASGEATKYSYDYPVDNTMFEWSYVPCGGKRYYPGDPGYSGPSINDMVWKKEGKHCNGQILHGKRFQSKVQAILACDEENLKKGGSCGGVFDADCNNVGEWVLCNNQAFKPADKSCIYEMQDKRIRGGGSGGGGGTGTTGLVTGYCKPNTAQSRIGGLKKFMGYTSVEDCYYARCAADPSCVAATRGTDGECIAYKQCTSLADTKFNWGKTTFKKLTGPVVTGYCNPNTAASRIGGFKHHLGYTSLEACYYGRCAGDSSCVAATRGTNGECIAYKRCTSIKNDSWGKTAYKKLSGPVTGYCKPNTAQSRIGGMKKFMGYTSVEACYYGRCAGDPSCVAATRGTNGECIAYKQCTSLADTQFNWGTTVYKSSNSGRRRSTADRLIDMMKSNAQDTDPRPEHFSAPSKEIEA